MIHGILIKYPQGLDYPNISEMQFKICYELLRNIKQCNELGFLHNWRFALSNFF